MASPPPALDLATLRRLAGEYNALSRGRQWPASEFVEFLQAELLTSDDRRDKLRRERGREKMRRWRARRVRRDAP
jgi:hypothetical protein